VVEINSVNCILGKVRLSQGNAKYSCDCGLGKITCLFKIPLSNNVEEVKILSAELAKLGLQIKNKNLQSKRILKNI
jgi:hypothetical protein